MKKQLKKFFALSVATGFCMIAFTSCQKETSSIDAVQNADESMITTEENSLLPGSESILLAIDEESIDNGNAPNNFSETDVNDQIASLKQRNTLKYFSQNVGRTITLYSGEVGDEGWHALKTIPSSWKSAGPTTNGSRNYLAAGPGLGSGENPEVLLDNIANVTPLRARGLKMLIGKTVLAVVYDGDVSTNYSPLKASLKGATLGLVALRVVAVEKRTDGSTGSLPKVKVVIENVSNAKAAALKLFSNAPVPVSSSVPFDVNPPVTVSAIRLTIAP